MKLIMKLAILTLTLLASCDYPMRRCSKVVEVGLCTNPTVFDAPRCPVRLADGSRINLKFPVMVGDAIASYDFADRRVPECPR